MDERRSRFLLVRVREVSQKARALGINTDKNRGMMDFYAILDTVTLKTIMPGQINDKMLEHLEELSRVHG